MLSQHSRTSLLGGCHSAANGIHSTRRPRKSAELISPSLSWPCKVATRLAPRRLSMPKCRITWSIASSRGSIGRCWGHKAGNALGRTSMNEQLNPTKTFFGACPHDCPDTCAMVYEVADGKLVNVKGNKQHPITRGTLCVKLKDFHDHHHNPDRLMYPLRRVGPK